VKEIIVNTHAQDCDLSAVRAGSGAFSLTNEQEQADIKYEVSFSSAV